MPGAHGALIIAYGTRESGGLSPRSLRSTDYHNYNYIGKCDQREGAGAAMHHNAFCVFEQYYIIL